MINWIKFAVSPPQTNAHTLRNVKARKIPTKKLVKVPDNSYKNCLLNSNSFWNKTIPTFLNPESSIDKAITRIIKTAWGELKNPAIMGAEKKSIKKRIAPLMADTVQAVSRYDSIFSFFWTNAALNPVWENVSNVDIERIAMPIRPKSSGASNLAIIIVRIKPIPRLIIRNVKTQTPPRITFFERGSVLFNISFVIVSGWLELFSNIIHYYRQGS